VFELNSAGNSLIYASYLGGSNVDNCDAVAVDLAGNIYLTGTTTSTTNFPVTSAALQSTYGGGTNDAYLSVVSATPTFPLNVSVSGPGSGTVTSNPAGINCGSVCSATLPTGIITLTANPAAGSVFGAWAGPCLGDHPFCTVSNNSNATVSANAWFILADFSIEPESSSLTLSAGAQGTDVITFAGLNHGPFANAIQLTCAVTGSTPAPTCGLSPTSVTPGSDSVYSTLTVTAPTSAQLRLVGSEVGSWMCAAFLSLPFGLALIGRSRKPRSWMLAGIAILLLLALVACGGGNAGTGNQPKTFTVNVTGTSGTTKHTTSITVTVQ